MKNSISVGFLTGIFPRHALGETAIRGQRSVVSTALSEMSVPLVACYTLTQLVTSVLKGAESDWPTYFSMDTCINLLNLAHPLFGGSSTTSQFINRLLDVLLVLFLK